MSGRRFSFFDRVIGELDQALRTVTGPAHSSRSNPGAGKPELALSDEQRALAGRLMRVNHSGEVAAQALYQSQSLTARRPEVRKAMAQAAREEIDHLAWTEERLRELGTHTSYLDPLWYAGSFTIGALAGLAGDNWNLGFVAETEQQVVVHLEGHLVRLPTGDARSRAIVEQMQIDEAHHATMAVEAGAKQLPGPIKALMRATAKVMTRTAYWV